MRWVFVLGFTVASVVAADELPEPTRSLSLDDALAFARVHQPRLEVARARLEVAENRAREPGAEWLPRFGVTAQVVGSSNNNSATNWQGSRGVVDLPRISGTRYLQQPSEINWAPYLNTVVGVSGQQQLYDFGRIAADRAVADAVADAERARVDDQRLSVELGVRETYYATLAARAIVGVARDAANRSKVHRDEAHARVAEGVRSRIEEVRADADLARFEVGVLRAESGLRAAEVAFAEAVGAPEPMLGAVDDGSATTPSALPTLEQVMAQLESVDPVVREAMMRARAGQERLRAAQARKLPDLWAVGTVSTAAGGAPKDGSTTPTWGAGAVPWIPDYFLGVVFAWRFYDPVLNARLDTTASEAEAAALELELAKQQSIARAQRAWLRADLAGRALVGLEHSLEAARANYQQAEVRFRSGLGTGVELADAEALRTEAEAELVLGRFEQARAKAGLERVMGRSP